MLIALFFSLCNPDLISLTGSKASARSQSPGGTSTVALSERLSLASGSLGAGRDGRSDIRAASSIATGHSSAFAGGDGADGVLHSSDGGLVVLSPQQLGVMGMEALEMAINHWEDALAALHTSDTAVEQEFSAEIQSLLDEAWNLQEQCELLFLDQRSVLFRSQSKGAKSGSGGGRHDSDPNLDSAESFASALDQVADLREFEEFGFGPPGELAQYALYQSAVRHLEETTIPCRTMRTEQLNCGSDVEFLAKLHCVRLAFLYLFKDPHTRQWIADMGRQILTDMLLLADKDPKDFLVGYEAMLHFVQEPENWTTIEVELSQRNVKSMTFFDVVLDFIIMDAFKDLDAPPASVTAVVQNRFLSNGFKETVSKTVAWRPGF